MSADNAVYVLASGSGNQEFRVDVLQGLEGTDWVSIDPEVIDFIKNRFRYAKVFTDAVEAFNAAIAIADNYREIGWILEYGVKAVRVPWSFTEDG